MLIWRLTSDRAPSDPAVGAAMSQLFRAPDWSWVQGGDVGWWVRAGWRDRLLDAQGGLRLDLWQAAGRLQTVKSGSHREVWRAELPAGEDGTAEPVVYVKHHRVPDRRTKWRQWFRRGKGRNEAQRAVRLLACGVPTIDVVALGERRKHGFLFDNYLVSIELPGMTPLDRFLEQHLPSLPGIEQGRLRRELAEELGRFVARLHGGGFEHADFHPGNIMVQVGGDGSPRLAMIDLDALRFRERLSASRAEQNLAILNQWFWLRSSRADRFRFLRSYAAARGVRMVEARAMSRRVEELTRSWAEQMWRGWGRRCLGRSKMFAAYRGPHAWGVASRALEPGVVASLLRDPDAAFSQPTSHRIKSSRTTEVADVELVVDGHPTRVIYKRFNRKKWLDPIYNLVRPSRGWRAWQNGQHVASRGLPTPRNLAWIARSKRGLRWLPHHFLSPYDTYVVTEKVEPSATLYDVAYTGLSELEAEARRARIRSVLRPLARLVRTLHERSLSHRDLKAANILVEPAAGGEPERLSLIDLVGVRLEAPLSRHHRVQNLARLQLSLARVPGRTRTDSLRFLRAYLPWSMTTDREWKALWRDVESACESKVRQNRRRNRQLT
jgi:tRNA A-37 threonylcarbamoyl transferase component Bud32